MSGATGSSKSGAGVAAAGGSNGKQLNGKHKQNGAANGNEPDSSDLSELESDADQKPKAKKQKGSNGKAVVEQALPPRRAPPPPRPPKVAPLPVTHALAPTAEQIPPTSSILARLNLREFILRFRAFMPSVEGKNAKQKQVLAALEDIIGFWRHDGEYGQRYILESLTELIEREARDVLVYSGEAGYKLFREGQRQLIGASNSSANAIISMPWITFKQIVQLEGTYKNPEDSWIIQRGVEDDGRERRSGKASVPVDERLRILEGLVDISLRTQIVKGDMNEVRSYLRVSRAGCSACRLRKHALGRAQTRC